MSNALKYFDTFFKCCLINEFQTKTVLKEDIYEAQINTYLWLLYTLATISSTYSYPQITA